MRHLKFCIIIFVATINSNAQNLIPNSSFEIKNSTYPCPVIVGDLPKTCTDWQYADGSTECYDVCAAGTPFGVPDNFVGGPNAYQQPYDGNAYGGIILLKSQNSHSWNEYLITKLSKKLNKNSYYHFEFYYSISEYTDYEQVAPFQWEEIPYRPISIGVYFSDTLISIPFPNPTMLSRPLMKNPDLVDYLPETKNVVDWIKFEGVYKANGTEEYIAIGHFKDSTTQRSLSYIFIDALDLHWIADEPVPPLDTMIIPNVFTPNGDGFNDIFIFKHQEQWKFETQIYNRWGNLIFKSKSSENWDGYFKGNKVSEGVYFYLIKAKAIKYGEVVIHKGSVTVIYN